MIDEAKAQLQILAAKVVDKPEAAAELLSEIARGRFAALRGKLRPPPQ